MGLLLLLFYFFIYIFLKQPRMYLHKSLFQASGQLILKNIPLVLSFSFLFYCMQNIKRALEEKRRRKSFLGHHPAWDVHVYVVGAGRRICACALYDDSSIATAEDNMVRG